VKLFGERVNSRIKYQRRVGAYGIIFHKKEFLLTEQVTSEGNIEVQLPGGVLIRMNRPYILYIERY